MKFSILSLNYRRLSSLRMDFEKFSFRSWSSTYIQHKRFEHRAKNFPFKYTSCSHAAQAQKVSFFHCFTKFSFSRKERIFHREIRVISKMCTRNFFTIKLLISHCLASTLEKHCKALNYGVKKTFITQNSDQVEEDKSKVDKVTRVCCKRRI